MSTNHHVPPPSSDTAGRGLYSNVSFNQSNASPLPTQQQPPAFNNQWQYQNGNAAAAANVWSAAAPQGQYYPGEYKSNPTYNQPVFNDASFQSNIHDPQYQPSTIRPSSLSVAAAQPLANKAVGPNNVQSQVVPAATQPQPHQAINDANLKSSQHGHMSLPRGDPNGQFQLLSADDLKPICPVRQMSSFLEVSTELFDIPITRATIPAYVPRKSRNEIKNLLRSDTNLKAKVNKKISKKAGGNAIKEVRLDATGQLAPVSRRGSQSSSEGSDYSSDEDSSDGESADEERPGPQQRPEKSVKAGILWDTIQAAWCPRNRSATPDEIRNGLRNFWQLVQSIRGRWKSDAEAVKAAEEAKKASELPMLKSRVTEQRQFFNIVMKAAIKHGHPDILKHCGENIALLNALAVCLQDRVKAADFDGELGRSILEFLTQCTTMTEGALDSSKVGRILPRFAAKGSAEVKVFVKRIQENATAASKKKKESAAKLPASSSGEGNAKNASSAGVKRNSASEGANGSPAKKTASVGANIKKQPIKPPTSIAAPDAAVKGSSSSSAAPVAAKPKPANVSASASFFDSLKSASKKPGTSIAAREAAKKTGVSTPAVAVKKPLSIPASSTAPAFDFGATLAGLKKTKDPEPAQTEKRAPAETEDERSRRLRKESRRKLSVRFKPDAELEQIRLFHHDPDEELGHDSSQMRDATDLGSEGRMFKMKALAGVDNDSDEEEEDNASARFNAAYPYLTNIDLSSLPEETNNFCFKPLGPLEIESADVKRQIQHEENNLIVIYSSSSDIPSTPGEPTQTEPEAPEKPPQSFGSIESIPKTEQYVDVAGRIERASHASQQPTAAAPAPPLLSADLQNLLASLGGQQQPPASSQPPVSNLDWIQNTFSVGQQNQPTYNQNSSIPPPIPFPAFQQPATTNTSAPPIDLAAILSAVQQTHAQAAAPAQPDWMNQNAYPPPAAPVVPAFGAMPFDIRSHKRTRSQDEDIESKRQKRQQQPKVGWQDGEPPKYVLPCKFWKEGKCTKGDNCTFRHDDD